MPTPTARTAGAPLGLPTIAGMHSHSPTAGPRSGPHLRRLASLLASSAWVFALALAAVLAVALAMLDLLQGPLAALALWLSALVCAAAGASTQQRRLRAQLHSARQLEKLMLQVSNVWVWRTDAEHRLIELQPPNDLPAAAWARCGPSGDVLWERWHDASQATAQRMRSAMDLPDTPVVLSRSGTDLPRAWRLRGLPLHDQDDQFIGYVGIVQAHADVAQPDSGGAAQPDSGAAATARPPEHRPDHTQDHTQEQAAFSYTVSHDLRAPLRVVEGFGRILKEDYGGALDRIGNDHLDRMVAAAARMNHMIDALLALSKLSVQPLQRQAVNLSQLAQFVIDDLQRAAPERRVSVRIQPGLSAHGDPTLLRMALDNLIGNAWKYSARQAQAEISFEGLEHAGQQALVVRDNGAGFDMRFADRLFGAFQRLHSSSEFQGHGVGLASVQRIVRRHGGTIWAEAEVGRGASFYFTLAA